MEVAPVVFGYIAAWPHGIGDRRRLDPAAIATVVHIVATHRIVALARFAGYRRRRCRYRGQIDGLAE